MHNYSLLMPSSVTVVEGMLSTAIAHATVQCAAREFVTFSPPNGQTCEQYMEPYLNAAGGYLRDPSSTTECALYVSPRDHILPSTMICLTQNYYPLQVPNLLNRCVPAILWLHIPACLARLWYRLGLHRFQYLCSRLLLLVCLLLQSVSPSATFELTCVNVGSVRLGRVPKNPMKQKKKKE